MKYVFFLCDGLSDRITALTDNNTSLKLSETPCADMLASAGICGIAKTADPAYPPETLRTDMHIIGCGSIGSYPGGPALEALSSGIPVEQEDVVLSCRLVSLTGKDEYEEKTITDAAPELSALQTDALFSVIDKGLSSDIFRFYLTDDKKLYCVWNNGEPEPGVFSPPMADEEIRVGDMLPKGDLSEPLIRLMKESSRLLSDCPVNSERLAGGRAAVDSIWFEAAGVLPETRSFRDKYGLNASMITSDRRLDGLAGLMEMKRHFLKPGDEGELSRAAACAVEELKTDTDIVIVHISTVLRHALGRNRSGKTEAIEKMDRELIAPVYEYLTASGEEHRIILMSSFSCCSSLGYPTSEPVPFLVYDSREAAHRHPGGFTEQAAFSADRYIPFGADIMKKLLFEG